MQSLVNMKGKTTAQITGETVVLLYPCDTGTGVLEVMAFETCRVAALELR